MYIFIFYALIECVCIRWQTTAKCQWITSQVSVMRVRSTVFNGPTCNGILSSFGRSKTKKHPTTTSKPSIHRRSIIFQCPLSTFDRNSSWTFWHNRDWFHYFIAPWRIVTVCDIDPYMCCDGHRTLQNLNCFMRMWSSSVFDCVGRVDADEKNARIEAKCISIHVRIRASIVSHFHPYRLTYTTYTMP